MGFLKNIKCRKKRLILENEISNSTYNFTNDEKALGIELNLFGYRENPNQKLINLKDGMVHMKIEDCELWMPENTFKSGELSYIYSEVFTPLKENPHAYETVNLRIEKDDHVIDAGACEGFFIKYALEKGAKTVYAFEPLKKLGNGLRLTYKKEIDAKKVKIINKGLSNISELIKFDTGMDYICEAKINKSGNEECEVTTLDQMVEAGIISQVDFIKMDIEGAEILAIKGVKNTIMKYKPKLSIATYHKYENANIIRDLIHEYRPDYNIVFGGCYTFEKPFRPFMVYAY